jgi:hypothetical protein
MKHGNGPNRTVQVENIGGPVSAPPHRVAKSCRSTKSNYKKLKQKTGFYKEYK